VSQVPIYILSKLLAGVDLYSFQSYFYFTKYPKDSVNVKLLVRIAIASSYTDLMMDVDGYRYFHLPGIRDYVSVRIFELVSMDG